MNHVIPLFVSVFLAVNIVQTLAGLS